jgi:hypothetical protein
MRVFDSQMPSKIHDDLFKYLQPNRDFDMKRKSEQAIKDKL